MSLMTRLQKQVTKQNLAITTVAAATNPITVVACVFNPVLAVAVVAGVAATVKACEVHQIDTLSELKETNAMRAWDKTEDVVMSIQYNEYPVAKTTEEISAEVDAGLEALRRELGSNFEADPELEAMRKELVEADIARRVAYDSEFVLTPTH